MAENNFYFAIREYDDRRSKPDRIRQAYTDLAANGKFWIHENHTEFVTGFTDFQDNVDWDLGDAGAMAICSANPWMLKPSSGGEASDEDDSKVVDDWIAAEEATMPDLSYEGGAP